MATCKDCLHVEVCKDYIKTVLDDFDDSQMCGDDCEFFRDRYRFLELPFLPGDKVYLIVDYDNEVRECTVFTMPIMIAPDNRWFQLSVKNERGAVLCDLHFSDIGETIFLTREEAERALKEREENE